MLADVVLPNVGFGMEEGRLLNWLKGPGDPVSKGEPIAQVEGDKTTVELEAVVSGVVEELLVPAGDMVSVGAVLARIRTDQPVSAPVSDIEAEAASRASPVAQRIAQEQGVDLASVAGTGPGGRITREDVEAAAEPVLASQGNGVVSKKVLAAPAVRKLARDNAVDLSGINGTGQGGRVTRADVESWLRAGRQPTTVPVPPPPPQPVVSPPPTPTAERTEVAVSRMRQTIAQRLSQSMQSAPHFYTTAQLDLTDALTALPDDVGINALLLYATVQALQAVPAMNATYEQGHLYQYSHVNLGIAIALPNGLIAPVLHHADEFSLSGLSNRVKDLVNRARSGGLRPEELVSGTFTISNLGIVEQVERFTAIVNPPQVGILAVGAAKQRPVVIDGGLHIRTTAYVTLSSDHRVVDGLVAARFLEALDQTIQSFGH